MTRVSLPRPVIAASWDRARAAGLAPDDRPDPTPVDISDAESLVDAAQPVLTRAAELLDGTSTALLLTDHRGRLVAHRSPDETLGRQLGSIGVVTGATFTESSVGTNGLGTPAEVRGGVTINSADHFLEQFRGVSCYGVPVIHPGTRRVAGVLCMVEAAPETNPLSSPLVRNLAHDIGEQLASQTHTDHRSVIAAFGKAAARRDIAVSAVGDDLQLTNALAAQLLSPADFTTLRLLVHEQTAPPTITLVSGIVVDVQVERLPAARHAAVFRLRPRVSDATNSKPASQLPNLLVPNSTRKAVAVDTAAVCGEPGTGRTTHALSFAPRESTTVIDVAAALLAGRQVDVPSAFRQSRSSGHGIVFDGADLLDDQSLNLLQSAIAARVPAEPPVVVVTGPLDALSPGAAAVVARCRRRITLAPLRQRTTELAALSEQLLRASGSSKSLAPNAADALASAQWPGNLAELALVLGQATRSATDRGARAIDVSDLPAAYQSSSRTVRLLGREQAERSAIIDALKAAAGNKSNAAALLGISRTTLYSRMRALGIHG